ncbi:MAG: arginyl-tRNA--protein-N-Asp/Glu arginylyltransferase [Spirosomataceae bacterium]|jgi:arginyl-tRNA--protein-N-Asp/Glu arginylyltransferase
MKIFLSENTVDYKSYTFNYAKYCVMESIDELTDVYENGFLPYSGDLRINKEIFYLARSLRVDIDRFKDSSENRRVNRTVEPLGIEMEVIPKADFDLQNADFQAFCEKYINERIGDENMSPQRLAYILEREVGTHILRFHNSEQDFGYVLGIMNEDILHYWFAFFDTEYMRTHSLGKWIMWSTIRWAADNGKKYVYLGTAYKSSSLYKIRDHKGLAFYDGKGWNTHINTLKDWCKSDEEIMPADRFKQLQNPNEFLENL